MNKHFVAIVIFAVLAVAQAITIPANHAKYTNWKLTDATDPAEMNGGKLGFEEPSVGCISMNIQGSNDAHILLTSEHGVTEPNKNSYEVLLGGWQNTKSVIRVGAEGEVVDSYPKNKWMDGSVLSATHKRSFWVCIADGEITVGRGKVFYADAFMTFTGLKGEPRRHDNLKYISLAAWDTPLVFSDIDMHHAKKDMMEFMVPGNFRKYRVFNRPNEITFKTSNQFEMVFECKGSAATLSFMPEESLDISDSVGVASERAIEFILDAKNSTATEIYYGNKAAGKARLLKSVKTHDLVDFFHYRSFWIRKWGQVVIIGKGEVVGRDAIAYAKLSADEDLAERSVVGFSAWDHPTAYRMRFHKAAEMLSESDMEENLSDYFDAITENKMETAMIAGGAKFNSELYEEWQKKTGEKNLDGVDQDRWEELQWELAAAGNTDAIAILTGTAPKPTPPKETAEQWEVDNY